MKNPNSSSTATKTSATSVVSMPVAIFARPRSAIITLIILFITAIIIYFFPRLYTDQLANFSHLLIFFATFLLIITYLFTAWRRRKLFFTLPAFFLPTLILFITLIIILFYKQNTTPLLHILGLGGTYLAGLTLILLVPSLLKKTSPLLPIYLILFLASFSTLTVLIQVFFLYNPTPLSSLLSFLPSDVNFHLAFISLGIITLGAFFYQKGKLKKTFLPFAPAFLLGLSAALILFLNQPASAINNFNFPNQTSFIQNTLFNSSGFNLPTFLIGHPTPILESLQEQFTTTALISPYQANTLSFPLIIFSLFGLLPLLGWLCLFVFIAKATFSHPQKLTHPLHLILFGSFCLQLFLPFLLAFFFIQIILFIFISLNQASPRTLTFLSSNSKFPQPKIARNITLITLSCLSITFFLPIFTFFLAQSLLQQTLSSPNLSLEEFSSRAAQTTKLSPTIDSFHRFQAVAQLENFFHYLQQTDPSLPGSTQTALELASHSLTSINQAIVLNPYNVLNYTTKASILWELAPYNHDQEHFFQEAVSTYGQAILLQPTHPRHYLSLAQIYQYNRQPELALNLAQQALKIAPTHPPTVLAIANLYQAQGNSEQAEQLYQQLLYSLDQNDENFANDYQYLLNLLQQF